MQWRLLESYPALPRMFRSVPTKAVAARSGNTPPVTVTATAATPTEKEE